MDASDEKKLRNRIADLEFDVETANRKCMFIATISLVAVTVLAIELMIHRQPVQVVRPF